MATKGYYQRKKRSYVRKVPYKPSGIVKTRQINNNTKKLRMLTNAIEYKYFEVVTNASPTNDMIIEDSLVKIAQGDTAITRDGRKIVITSIHFKGHLVVDAGAANGVTRLVLYVDKQPAGAVAPTTAYFKGAPKRPYAYRNLEQLKRFKVLYDKTHTMNSYAATSAATIKPIRINIKCNHAINYTSTTGAITELLESNIGFMSSSLNSLVDIDGVWRIRYMDL